MKKRIIALGLAAAMLFSLTACSPNAAFDEGTEEDTTINTEENTETISEMGDLEGDVNNAAMDLAVKLLRAEACKLEAPGTASENVLVSPTSIMMALAMTANGAKGDTLTQMEDVFGMRADQLSTYLGDYVKQLSQTDTAALKMANSIWFTDDDGFVVKDAFLQTNNSYFGEENYSSYQVPFDDKTLEDINNWVNDKTDGTIPSILDQIPEEAVMYLINALVFEAEWEDEYTDLEIHQDLFTLYYGSQQEVDMMYSEENLYLEDENATGFIKYYKGREYAFVAILPNEDTNIFEYINTLDGAHLNEMLSNPTTVHVNAYMPQFTVEYETELSEALAGMGMTDLFDSEKADLSGLGTSEMGNISVSRVLHKTFIEVTPVGTKAGAATVTEVVCESAPIFEEQKEVKLDRPFIYMIIDCENNEPIFMGTVNYVYPYRCGVICEYPEADSN